MCVWVMIVYVCSSYDFICVYMYIYIYIYMDFVILYGGIICIIHMYYMYNGSVWYLRGNRTL